MSLLEKKIDWKIIIGYLIFGNIFQLINKRIINVAIFIIVFALLLIFLLKCLVHFNIIQMLNMQFSEKKKEILCQCTKFAVLILFFL